MIYCFAILNAYSNCCTLFINNRVHENSIALLLYRYKWWAICLWILAHIYTKFLSIILRLPFFLMYLIMPFCEVCYLPHELESFIVWLGYVLYGYWLKYTAYSQRVHWFPEQSIDGLNERESHELIRLWAHIYLFCPLIRNGLFCVHPNK